MGLRRLWHMVAWGVRAVNSAVASLPVALLRLQWGFLFNDVLHAERSNEDAVQKEQDCDRVCMNKIDGITEQDVLASIEDGTGWSREYRDAWHNMGVEPGTNRKYTNTDGTEAVFTTDEAGLSVPVTDHNGPTFNYGTSTGNNMKRPEPVCTNSKLVLTLLLSELAWFKPNSRRNSLFSVSKSSMVSGKSANNEGEASKKHKTAITRDIVQSLLIIGGRHPPP